MRFYLEMQSILLLGQTLEIWEAGFASTITEATFYQINDQWRRIGTYHLPRKRHLIAANKGSTPTPWPRGLRDQI